MGKAPDDSDDDDDDDAVPPYGDSQSLRGAGAGTDHLRLQTFGLEDVEERVAGRD